MTGMNLFVETSARTNIDFDNVRWQHVNILFVRCPVILFFDLIGLI